MYYAVCNLDDLTIVSIEPSEQSAQDTMFQLAHPAQPDLIPPLRNLLIIGVKVSLWIAYSEGMDLELVFDGGRIFVSIVNF